MCECLVVNFFTGLASFFGVQSGKCLTRGTRNKHCRLCERGNAPDNHRCHKNWEGSAKAMEPDIAVEMIAKNKQLQEANVLVKVVIGDDDCSTISSVRREREHTVEKWSDLNHATKKLSRALWAQKINPTVIEYSKYCFTCALKKNKGNAQAVEKDMKCIIPHAFDKHENCGEWCRYTANPVDFKHHRLSGGKGLQGEPLRTTLTTIFEPFINNVEKLAPCGSSQVNESFNALVASKNPKALHYGGSGSFDHRVDAAVLHKNEGTNYIVDLNQKCGASPGKLTAKYRQRKDEQRARRAKACQVPAFKSRRKELKKLRTGKKKSSQRKEGTTYATDSALERISEFVHKPLSQATSIPDDLRFVYFDLETTGISTRFAEICQIGAKYQGQEFNAYIIPVATISKKITEITGLSVHDGVMFYNEKSVPTVSL